MNKSLMIVIASFCAEWKETLTQELTSQHRRERTEKFLSDEQTSFRFTPQKASRVFISESQQKHCVRRRAEGTNLSPLWRILADDTDQIRSLQQHEEKVKQYERYGVAFKLYESEDIADEYDRDAVLYMIGVINPRVKVTLKSRARADRQRRIPTHRHNGELYTNGRLL